MDSERNTPSIRYSTDDILRSTGYMVSCYFDSESSLLTIKSSFSEKVYTIQYSEGYLNTSDLGSIKCSPVEAISLATVMVRDICKILNYPYKYLRNYINDKPTDTFFFDINELEDEDIDKTERLQELSVEIYNYGLTRERLLIAGEAGLLEEIYMVCGYIYGAAKFPMDIVNNEGGDSNDIG